MKTISKAVFTVLVLVCFSLSLNSCGDELNKDLEDANIENESFVDPDKVKPPTHG